MCELQKIIKKGQVHSNLQKGFYMEKFNFIIRDELLKKALTDEEMRKELLNILVSGNAHHKSTILGLDQDGKIKATSVRTHKFSSKKRKRIFNKLITFPNNISSTVSKK